MSPITQRVYLRVVPERKLSAKTRPVKIGRARKRGFRALVGVLPPASTDARTVAASQTTVLRNVRHWETNGGPGRCCFGELTFVCEWHRWALPWFGWETFPRRRMEGNVPCGVGRLRMTGGGVSHPSK